MLIFQELDEKLNQLYREMQIKMEQEFSGLYWKVDGYKYDKKVFFGTYEDVQQLIILLTTKKEKLIPYDIVEHGLLIPIDAKEEFCQKFKAESYGDLIKVDGILYKVNGFTPIDIHLTACNTKDILWINRDASYEMVYSKHYDFDLRDRLRHLF